MGKFYGTIYNYFISHTCVVIMNQAWNIILKKTDSFKLQRGLTSFVNPYSMKLLQKEEKIAFDIDQWCVDGASLVTIINKTFKRNIHRYSFDDTSVTNIVFPFVKKNNYKVAVIGTKEAFIHNAVNHIELKHQIKVTYWRNGYFTSEDEREECFQKILSEDIEMVICGMGTPHQEKFLLALKAMGWNGYGYTCGGYLHQVARKPDYYPEIFNKLNIRWIYRIVDEPKLIKRYFIDYPVFLLKFYRFILRTKMLKNSL